MSQHPGTPPRTVVVIPTFCEVDSLETVLLGVRRELADADILVVDDSSPDGTGELAERLAAQDPHLHVLHRPAKRGLGHAYIAGFTWALDRGYTVVAQMDADGSHLPAELPRLVAAVTGGAEVAIGTRWMPGGQVRNWPWHRRAISRAGTAYARLMLGSPLRDLTSGFRAFTAEALRTVQLSALRGAGYVFQVEVASALERSGRRIVEVPITFVERRRGRSKMSARIVLEAITWVTAARLRSGRRRRG